MTDIEKFVADIKADCVNIHKRLETLERGHDFFEKSVLKDIANTEKATEHVENILESLRTEVLTLPDKVSLKMNLCKADIEKTAGDLYAKKTDVITPQTLRNTLVMVATVITLIFSGTSWVLDQVAANTKQNRSVEQHAHTKP